MSPWLITLAIVVLFALVRHGQRSAERRELPPAVRARWGRPRAIATELDGDVRDAWRDTASLGAVDARTWDDLELERVLASIDHTETMLGAQRLYHRVREGRPWNDSPLLEAVADRCTHDAATRDALGELLASAGRGLGRGFWPLVEPGAIRLRWWYAAFPVIAIGMLVSLGVALFVDPRAVLVVALLAVLSMAGRAAATWQVPWLLTPLRQLCLLLAVAERLLTLAVLPAAEQARLQSRLAPLRSLRVVSRIFGAQASGAGAMQEVAASAWEYLNLFLLLDANALLVTGRRLQRHAAELVEVAELVGDVDLARAVASVRAEPRAWCRPQFDAEGAPGASGVWHPLVAEPVANDVPLAVGGGLVITGANMSGKSTYLRSAGVAAVLAVALDLCPATRWSGRALRVRSLIGRADDLASGRSYYMVEAEGVVGLLHDAMAAPPTLYLLDELLRGTNTVERIAAGEAVVRTLLAPGGAPSRHTVFVATHDGELTELLGDVLAPCHFRETVDASGLHFEYVRHAGAARSRTAIALLAACGAPDAVVRAAARRADAVSQHGASRHSSSRRDRG